MNHSVRMTSGMSDDRMKLINKSMMGNDGVHDVLVHIHVTADKSGNLLNPAIVSSVH